MNITPKRLYPGFLPQFDKTRVSDYSELTMRTTRYMVTTSIFIAGEVRLSS